MNDLLDECLGDLEIALQWLELPNQQKPPIRQIEKCRSNLLVVKAFLAAKAQKDAPLKWLGLRTNAYNSLMRAGYQTIEAVLRLSPEQLLAIPRIGTVCKDEIIKALEDWYREPPKTLARQGSHFEP